MNGESRKRDKKKEKLFHYDENSFNEPDNDIELGDQNIRSQTKTVSREIDMVENNYRQTQENCEEISSISACE